MEVAVPGGPRIEEKELKKTTQKNPQKKPQKKQYRSIQGDLKGPSDKAVLGHHDACFTSFEHLL